RGIDIGLVAVADPEEFVFERERLPLADDMVDVFVIEPFQRCGKRRLSRRNICARDGIVYAIGQYFSGIESGIPDAGTEGCIGFAGGILDLTGWSGSSSEAISGSSGQAISRSSGEAMSGTGGMAP